MQFYYSKHPSKLLSFCVVIVAALLASACAVNTTDPFVPVDSEPYTDMMLLQSALVYPPEAKRLGVQGKVSIRVLVNKKGIAQKYIVETTDSPLFVDEAVRLVMNAVYMPALYHKQPIDCWVLIPIVFKL